MQTIPAVVRRQHTIGIVRIAHGLSKSITPSNACLVRIQSFTAFRFASFSGVKYPFITVPSKGVIVAPKILIPFSCARSIICFKPAMISSALTVSDSGAEVPA